MPQYRFVIKHASGETKTGRLTADSRSQAEQRLTRTGFVVVEISEVQNSSTTIPKLQVSNSRQSSRAEANPGALPLASRMMATLEPWAGRIGGMLLLAVAVGVLWGLWSASRPKELPPEPPKPTAISASVEGSLELNPASDLSDVTLTIEFPEVPFQKSTTWSELKHTPANGFQLQASFQTLPAPNYYTVRASKAGYKDAVSDKQLLNSHGPVRLRLSK